MAECAGCCNTFCQGVTGVLLFLLMLAALVANKVSLVWLLGGTIINNVDLETWYAAFGLVFIVPELFALLKVVWHTSFIKRTRTHRWPSALAIFVGFLTSFAEVASFMVFTIEVAPRLPVQVLLPLLNAVFAVPLCHEQWEHIQWRKPKAPSMTYDSNFTLERKADSVDDIASINSKAPPPRRKWCSVLLTILGFSGVWSSCAISAIVALTVDLPWFQALCLPASLCLLSLCWAPKVQVYTVRSSDGTFNGRWKASCLYTLFKIVILIAGLSTIMLFRLQEHGILNKSFFYKLIDGLYACRHKEIFYPLLIHFCSSFMVHTLGYVACTLTMPGLVMTLPSIIATPASVAIVIFFCFWGHDWLDEIMCFTDNPGIWCACSLAIITWIAPFVIRRQNLNKNGEIVLKPYDELFIQPTWNSIFIDQHMCLNYKHDGFSGSEHIILPPGETINNRIFICTTMYREADFEMGRLLKSLVKVSESKKIKNTYFEAHIFMDNGTSDLHLTDFASQLISLLETKVGVTAKDANAFMTPYGVQLNWILPGGMPFFIHLKDSGKVKPKKRWSQVMYMSYVLNFRVMRDHTHERLKLLTATSDSNIDDSIFVGYASDKEWEKNNSALTKEGNYKSKREKVLSDNEIMYDGERRGAGFKKSNRWYPTPASPDAGASVVTNTTSMTSITSIINTFGAELIQNSSSSDQGIGTVSDEFSSSSNSNQADESSEATISATNSVRQVGGMMRDEGWQDYDGDLSSNNENSITSSNARKFTERRFNDGIIYEHGGDSQQKPPERRRRHQTPHPPRHHRHGQRKSKADSGKSIGIERQNSRTHLISRQESFGHDNLAFCDSQTSILDSSLSLSASETKLHRIQGNPAIRLRHAESEIFVISHDTVPDSKTLENQTIPLDDHTYILATDADMEFDDESVKDLLDLCNGDRRIGGACGRTHPIGQRSGPLVWYQKFEYAKDFWMIKSAQNVIGSVMCCPGCFSLYRAGAIRDVLAYYAGPTDHPFDVFVKDTGEDRWMCTLMMIHGWKLEYTSFCNNTTYCPDTFQEFMKQRRRWVLSDMSNMILVFKNIIKLAQKNDSFSIAFILYMLQMFLIVLLSPASTIVILSGGLDIVFGVPFEFMAPLMGVIVLTYALICILGSLKVQVRTTLILTLLMGVCMMLVVIGGAVYVIQDMSVDWRHGTLTFQEYYLILLLIAALIFAAFIHPRESWIMSHGMSYLLGFPAMQILLPIYAICNIVDQSWGTRDSNESKTPPVTCFSKNRKKYHKSLSRKSHIPDEDTTAIYTAAEDELPVDCTSQFKPMQDPSGQRTDEFVFWDRLRELVLGRQINLGLEGDKLADGLRSLRNICLIALITLNSLWLVLLSVLYFNADVNLAKLNIYGLIALIVYGLVLFVQLLGMTVHRVQALFTRFARAVFGRDKHMWIHTR